MEGTRRRWGVSRLCSDDIDSRSTNTATNRIFALGAGTNLFPAPCPTGEVSFSGPGAYDCPPLVSHPGSGNDAQSYASLACGSTFVLVSVFYGPALVTAHAPVSCQPQAARAERVRELVYRDIT